MDRDVGAVEFQDDQLEAETFFYGTDWSPTN